MAQYLTKLTLDSIRTLNLSEEDTNTVKRLLRHKRKSGKQPVKNPKTETFKIRLTETELKKLQNFAIAKNVSASQIIRNYIHRLPSAENTELDSV